MADNDPFDDLDLGADVPWAAPRESLEAEEPAKAMLDGEPPADASTGSPSQPPGRAPAVDEALRAIDGALRAIAVALGGEEAGGPPAEPAPVMAALAEALAGRLGGAAPDGLMAAMRDLAERAEAARRVRERTGIDLQAWRPDAGLRCQ